MTTTSEIFDAIQAYGGDEDEDGFEEFADDLQWPRNNVVKLPMGDATLVDQHGGEGQGDQYYVVFKLADRHFMLSAYYSSWEGVYWGDATLTRVEPYEKTVIDYREVNDD